MAYAYDSYIPREIYDRLFPEEKQQALLQGVVLESSSLSETDLKSELKNIFLDIEVNGEVHMKEGGFESNEKDGQIKLCLKDVPEGELYVVFEDIRFVSNENTSIKIENDMMEKRVNIYGSKEAMYCGNHNFICNIGYTPFSEEKEILLTFREPGDYTFADIRVVVQPWRKAGEWLDKLEKNGCTHFVVEKDKIATDITMEKAGALCLAIPYDEGFQAYVDGIRQPIKRANTMFMAVELGEGYHFVELKYCTYGLKAGLIVMLIGMIGVCLITVWEKKNVKSVKNTG